EPGRVVIPAVLAYGAVNAEWNAGQRGDNQRDECELKRDGKTRFEDLGNLPAVHQRLAKVPADKTAHPLHVAHWNRLVQSKLMPDLVRLGLRVALVTHERADDIAGEQVENAEHQEGHQEQGD